VTDKQEYFDFLMRKIRIAERTGVTDVSVDIPEKFKDGTTIKPHQRDAVAWAIEGGRRALFESFGLGKTIQQLLICNILAAHENGRALIICPLSVKREFENEAKRKLGIDITYIKSQADAVSAKTSICITNYERVRDGDIDVSQFVIVSLDEASVLRSYGSKTYQEFLPKFAGIKYKYVCTATPSPNRLKELIHYAGFLEVMDTGQALTRFFQRNSQKANELTLYEHKVDEFWLWVGSWALFINTPADLGYDATGYDMPPLKVEYIEVESEKEVSQRFQQLEIARRQVNSLSDAASEKRNSIPHRLSAVKTILAKHKGENAIIWHHLESERAAIMKDLDGAVDVYGSQDIEVKENLLQQFADGEIKYLATKPEIAGQGCNFQRHCRIEIFMGINYEFNDFIQAIHRVYRFGQEREVIIYVIYTEFEHEILTVLKNKWKLHHEMSAQMRKVIAEHGLHITTKTAFKRYLMDARQETKSQTFHAVNRDNVLETKDMEADSVGLIVTSIPFANHYEYTPTYNDFGHTSDNDEFFAQMDFLTPELLRVLQPGRIAAIHVKDRILFGNATGDGMPTLDPFSDLTVMHYLKHGFKYLGRIHVNTDVVRENNQTYRLGWTENSKDGTKMGVGCPEYVLLFRKLPSDKSNAYADIPVIKSKEYYGRGRWQIDADAFWRSSGDRLLTADDVKSLADQSKVFHGYKQFSKDNIYDYKTHLEIAETLEKNGKLSATFGTMSPSATDANTWDDVMRFRTLNLDQANAKKQKHVCPLQLDLIERLIIRYSNEGEKVLDPFGGIMSVPYVAVKTGRFGMGIELSADYYRDGVKYLKDMEQKICAPTLFEALEITGT